MKNFKVKNIGGYIALFVGAVLLEAGRQFFDNIREEQWTEEIIEEATKRAADEAVKKYKETEGGKKR